MPATTGESRTAQIVTFLLAASLLLGGAANLAGVQALHTSFAELGLPVRFGYLIGALEVAAAIGLFLRPLRVPAAAGSAVIMVGALYYHVVMGHPEQGLPAAIMLLLSVYLGVHAFRGAPSVA